MESDTETDVHKEDPEVEREQKLAMGLHRNETRPHCVALAGLQTPAFGIEIEAFN